MTALMGLQLRWQALTRLGQMSPAAAVIPIFLLLGVLGPVIAPYDPTAQDLSRTLEAPSTAHLLGTDHLGRDELSRLLAAAQTSLVAVVLVAMSTLAIGLLVGVTAGFLGGWLGRVLMRLVDVFIAMPSLILGLALLGLLGPSLITVVVALALTWWPPYARLARAQILVTRRLPYIEALAVVGASRPRILLRHLIPAAIGPVLILLSADAGNILLTVAMLSFLGLGIQPPTPEWGQMLADARPYLQSTPILIVAPGAAITLVVLGLNLLGESLMLRFDPAARHRR